MSTTFSSTVRSTLTVTAAAVDALSLAVGTLSQWDAVHPQQKPEAVATLQSALMAVQHHRYQLAHVMQAQVLRLQLEHQNRLYDAAGQAFVFAGQLQKPIAKPSTPQVSHPAETDTTDAMAIDHPKFDIRSAKPQAHRRRTRRSTGPKWSSCLPSAGDYVQYAGIGAAHGQRLAVMVTRVSANVPGEKDPKISVQMPDGSVRDTVLERLSPMPKRARTS
eukprot:COSAG06_NODE_1682_length_8731_cov_5.569045_3_plen_219_part_00